METREIVEALEKTAAVLDQRNLPSLFRHAADAMATWVENPGNEALRGKCEAHKRALLDSLAASELPSTFTKSQRQLGEALIEGRIGRSAAAALERYFGEHVTRPAISVQHLREQSSMMTALSESWRRVATAMSRAALPFREGVLESEDSHIEIILPKDAFAQDGFRSLEEIAEAWKYILSTLREACSAMEVNIELRDVRRGSWIFIAVLATTPLSLPALAKTVNLLADAYARIAEAHKAEAEKRAAIALLRRTQLETANALAAQLETSEARNAVLEQLADDLLRSVAQEVADEAPRNELRNKFVLMFRRLLDFLWHGGTLRLGAGPHSPTTAIQLIADSNRTIAESRALQHTTLAGALPADADPSIRSANSKRDTDEPFGEGS